MIILPENGSANKAQQARVDSEPANNERAQLLPPPPVYTPRTYDAIPDIEDQHQRSRSRQRRKERKRPRRFLHALLRTLALALPLAIILHLTFTRSLISNSPTGQLPKTPEDAGDSDDLPAGPSPQLPDDGSGNDDDHTVPDKPVGRSAWPLPEDGKIDQCIYGGAWDTVIPSSSAYSAFTHLDVPASSDLMFLLARGEQSRGSVIVEQRPRDELPENAIRVKVAAAFDSRSDFDASTICLLARSGRQIGVGIYTPDSQLNSSTVRSGTTFLVTLMVPFIDPIIWSSRLPALETRLPQFQHYVSGLNQTLPLLFQTLSISSTESAVQITNTIADAIQAYTSNAPVIVVAAASSTLILNTTNAAIIAQAELFNLEYATVPAQAVFQTTQSTILANLTLTCSSHKAGQWNATAISTNASIALNIHDAPLNPSTLHVDMHTTYGIGDVSLHPTFEGSFLARHSYSSPKPQVMLSPIISLRNITDPANGGRNRSTSLGESTFRNATYASSIAHGEISWCPDLPDVPRVEPGSVFVETLDSVAIISA